MSSVGYHRSRVVRVSASLLLSTAYFVAALGVYQLSQGRFDTAADTVGSCTPPTQQTEDFERYPLTSGAAKPYLLSAQPRFGKALKEIEGWTVTGGGTQLIDDNPSQSVPVPAVASAVAGPATTGVGSTILWSNTPFRATHALSARSTGELSLVLNPRAGWTIALSGATGSVIRVANKPTTELDKTQLEVTDPITNAVQAFPVSAPTPGQFPLFIKWSPNGYDLFVGGTTSKINSTPLTLVGTTLPITTLTLEATGSGGPWWFDNLAVPAGDATPCLTAISPESGAAGTEVTLTGSQFESTGMKVTMMPQSGQTITIEPVTSVDVTHVKFTVPGSTAPGSYQVGVMNSAGASTQKQTFTVTAPTACVKDEQQSDTFNPGNIVDGSPVTLPNRWTVDAGTVVYGVDRNISRSDTGDAWLAIHGRIVRSTREALTGSATFKLSSHLGYTAPALPTDIPPFDVTLLTKSGSPLTLRFSPVQQLTVPLLAALKYRDPLSGEFKVVENTSSASNPPGFGTPQELQQYNPWSAVNHENTVSLETTVTVSWDGTNFTLDSPFAANSVIGTGTKSKSYRYAQNEPTAITGIALTGAAGKTATPTMNLLVRQVTFPVEGVPCVTGISPSSGPEGTEVTLTGSQFESSGMRVTMTPGNGEALTISQLTFVDATHLKFTVPRGTTPRDYEVGVTNSAGPSHQKQRFTVTSTLTGISPASGPAGTEVTLTGNQFESTGMKVTMQLPGARTLPLTISQLTFVDATHLKFTVPAGTQLGEYDVRTVSSTGVASAQSQRFTVTGSVTTTTGSTIACLAGDPAKQFTDDFSGFEDGVTSGFGWDTAAATNSSIAIRKDVGKEGNALQLVDTASVPGEAGVAVVTRPIVASSTGSVSFDVKPAQTTGRFTVILGGSKGDQFALSLAPDGTLQALDDSLTTGSKTVRIGTGTYRANEWLTLKLDWTDKGVAVTVNGTKATAQPLPYSSKANVAPVSRLTLTTGIEAGTGFTGSYLVDNVSYPGCSVDVRLTVQPTVGTAPLPVTATVKTSYWPTKDNVLSLPLDTKVDGSYRDASPVGIHHTRTESQQPTGSFPTEREGKVGKALQFDGSDDVLTVENASALDAVDHVSVAAWVKLDDTQRRTIIAKAVDGMSKGGWALSTNGSQQLRFELGDNPSTAADAPAALLELTGTTKLNSGTWYHVAATYDNSRARLYVDGKLDGESAVKAGALTPANGHPITVGVRQDKDGKQRSVKELLFKGSIDEIGTWKRALSETEIKRITQIPSSLAASIDFADGTVVVGPSADAPVQGGAIVARHTYSRPGTFTLLAATLGQTLRQDVAVTTVTTQTNDTTGGSGSAATASGSDASVDTAAGSAQKIAQAARLVASGGSLAINLLVASILAFGTTYTLLRRKTG